jgi:hypothetical protein
MIQPQLRLTRINSASNNRNVNWAADGHESASVFRLESRPDAAERPVLVANSPTLTSLMLCGEIKVKVGSSRIMAMYSLSSAVLVCYYSYNP